MSQLLAGANQFFQANGFRTHSMSGGGIFSAAWRTTRVYVIGRSSSQRIRDSHYVSGPMGHVDPFYAKMRPVAILAQDQKTGHLALHRFPRCRNRVTEVLVDVDPADPDSLYVMLAALKEEQFKQEAHDVIPLKR